MLPADGCSASSPDPIFPPVPVRPVSQSPREPCRASASPRSLQHLHRAPKRLEFPMSTRDKLRWQRRLRRVARGHPTRHREPKRGPHPRRRAPSITIPPAWRSPGSDWQSPPRLPLSPLNTGCSRTIKRRLNLTCSNDNNNKKKPLLVTPPPNNARAPTLKRAQAGTGSQGKPDTRARGRGGHQPREGRGIYRDSRPRHAPQRGCDESFSLLKLEG